ncbi:hypothetical protein [Brevibacillus choshinensis]|uniref:Uncharacterized protein n=1 Tax=Brevibacillus choshinensis TaxID=54911 RepID=A0ABX7FX79_BRECH|nr:hypothetical protein [Brevibacillus choshinensis]QRG70405.1 hypothetical protein JNE38_01080 [Brevibacillus choshinensis]
MLFFLLVGIFVVDTDIAMQKKTEVKMLLELANHHATFAVDPILKTEGVIDLLEDQALERFEARMHENGGYRRERQAFLPAGNSITTDPLIFTRYYVDFRAWRQDLELRLRYNGNALVLERAMPGAMRPGGGRLQISVITEEGEELCLAPKTMVGPSHVVVAFVEERPFLPMLPSHAFPVVSVEELKH